MILISFYPKRSLKRTTASLQFDIGGAKLKHCIYCKIFCDDVLHTEIESVNSNNVKKK